MIGASVLMLPASTPRDRMPLGFVDSVFTAASAVCVTGLVVRDTGADFSLFGQVAILILIQAGGLGFLTLTNLLFLARGREVGFKQRMMLQETVGMLPTVPPSTILFRIFLFTFISEGIGAGILTLRFLQEYPIREAAWLGVFHAVSAFCNAGFSLFSDSLVRYQDDVVVNITVITLIVLGGIGFLVAADMGSWLKSIFRRRHRLSFHTRVVLRTSLLLGLLGTLMFMILQVNAPGATRNWKDELLEPLFLSVAARTAGFNTVEMSGLTNAGLLVMMLLMIIGGSPGSTAGGIKTTTFATLYALIRSRALNRPKVELMNRSIPHEVQAKAFSAVAGFFLVAVAAVIALEMTEHYGSTYATVGGNFLPHLFEVISALGTVGLSMGVTPELTSEGKLVLAACMFIGRIGPVIVAGSFIGMKRRMPYTFPEERLIIG